MKAEHKAVDFKKKYRQCIITSACIFGACFSLMLSPAVNYSKDEGSVASGIILSIATWALVIGASVLVQRIWAFVSDQAPRDNTYPGERYRKERIGLLTFAANAEGLAAEVMLLAGIIVWILRAAGVIYFEGPMRMLQYSLTFSGLLLHCFFNGKNYIYIKRKARKEKHMKRGAHE